jgi:hypothetical protein
MNIMEDRESMKKPGCQGEEGTSSSNTVVIGIVADYIADRIARYRNFMFRMVSRQHHLEKLLPTIVYIIVVVAIVLLNPQRNVSSYYSLNIES